MNDKFVSVKINDNFYQTSAFYPMPVVLITTISASGLTNIGPYSLVFPFGISEKHSMMLISRADSNTAVNIRRNKYAALNFLPFSKKYQKNIVSLGFPGQKTEDKLKESQFTLIKSIRGNDDSGNQYPEIIQEAAQVFECTWDDSQVFHYNGPEIESHFLLRINKILLKEKWEKCLIKGSGFPCLPIDYGYRDNNYFWFARHKKPYPEPLPEGKGTSVQTVIYQANRIDPDIKWEDEACARLQKIPRIFLKRAPSMIVDKAREQNITTITPEVLENIRDKHFKDKK